MDTSTQTCPIVTPDIPRGIVGLISDTDFGWLRVLSNSAARLDGYCMVEIGSHQGLSATAILQGNAMACAANPNLKQQPLFCFDFFDRDTFWTFLNNTRSWREGSLIAIPGDVRQSLPEWIRDFDPTISLAFIDHDHSYELSKFCWDILWPKMVPGGEIVFHDYFHPDFPGGTKFIQELAIPFRTYQSLAVFTKPA